MPLLAENVLNAGEFPKRPEPVQADEKSTVARFGPDPPRPVRLVKLESTENLVEAEIRAGWLGANGITCFVTNNTTWSIGVIPVTEQMRPVLLIPEDRLEEARQVLLVLEAGGNLSLAEAEYLAEE